MQKKEPLKRISNRSRVKYDLIFILYKYFYSMPIPVLHTNSCTYFKIHNLIVQRSALNFLKVYCAEFPNSLQIKYLT